MKWFAVTALILLAACQPDTFGRSPAEIAEERKQCLADGGRFEAAGFTDSEICFRKTSDAGQTCARNSDCSGYCLASDDTPGQGICSAEAPQFGCIDQLDDRGERVVICEE